MAESAPKKSKTNETSTTCSSSPVLAFPESAAPPTANGANILPSFTNAPPPVPLAENPFLRALGIAPEALFSFLDMKDANILKLVCKLTREDVRNAYWSVKLNEMADDKSQHVANLQKWRYAYPNALSATLSSTATFPSEDYVHLRGVRYLDLNGNKSITDEAFGHFQTFRGEKGIHTLRMSFCTQITDQAFENLRGINVLNMSYCRQITDQAFEYLRGINTLYMHECTQITDQVICVQ